MKNWGTKKNVTFTSVIVVMILLAWNYIGNVHLCTWGEGLHYDCLDVLWGIEMVLFFPTLALALLAIITYNMRDEIFTAWITFAKWWFPSSMIAILIAPEVIRGSISVPIKWPLAVFCSATLFVVSLSIVGWKHFSLKKNKT